MSENSWRNTYISDCFINLVNFDLELRKPFVTMRTVKNVRKFRKEYVHAIEWTVSFNLHTFCMGKAIIVYFLTLKGRKFHSKHVNFVQKLGKLVVTMWTLKNVNIPAGIFSFLRNSCCHTYLFVSILHSPSLCPERHLIVCQVVFFFSLKVLACLWLVGVKN